MKQRPPNHPDASHDTVQSAQQPGTDTLTNSVLILLAVTLVQRTVGFGRGLLFCRWLDPQELGEWELVLSFLLLAAPLAVLGLPGSFGRYVEHYRRKGQLRTFLRRTMVWTAVLSAAAIVTIIAAAPRFSQLVFGHPDGTTLVVLMALSLGPIIVHHFLESLFAALRMFRVVSGMQFVQSLGFAIIGIALLRMWRFSAVSIVVAYGSASLLAAVGGVAFRLRPALADLPATCHPLPHAQFWGKLLRFSMWVWVTNLLANLFIVVDRYMIVHCGGFETGRAIAEVGQYHCSRVMPLLLVSIANMLAVLITPYLSHDWEAGRQRLVARNLNLALKLVSLGTLLAAVAILLTAEPLFDLVLHGKFVGGQAILPWTLAYCGLFGIGIVAQNYLWCAEKARLCSLPLLVGLVGNVGLNLILLPRLGLVGAVLATTLANVVALVLTLVLSRMAGMTIDGGTWLLCASPVVIGFGLWPTVVALAGIALALLGTDRLLTRSEKDQLIAVAGCYAGHARRLAQRAGTAPVAK